MSVIYCQKCHNKKKLKAIEKVNEDIQNTLNRNDIQNNCMSYCAIASNTHVVMVDDEIVEADTYEELLEILGDEYAN